jgi:hypothetical protein
MNPQISREDRLALAVTAAVSAVRVHAADARCVDLDRQLRPMRNVIEDFEQRYGPDVVPADHPGEFADLVARHGASHLRERDIQILHAALADKTDRDDVLRAALADLDEARAASGDSAGRGDVGELLSWIGASREHVLEALNAALRDASQPV